jgi:chromosomal replication initiator protein
LIDRVLEFDIPRSDAALNGSAGSSAYIVGPENLLVAPAVRRLLDGADLADPSAMFNPLVIVGPSGSGKSHLVQGLARLWTSRHGAEHVGYYSAADFGRERQSAHIEQRLAAWRSSVRSLKLLVVEDIDRLRARTTIQCELRQAIDALVAARGMIVATSARDPLLVANLDGGLRDRLAAGLTVHLKPPGQAARRAILQHAASARGLTLAADQLEQLARRECSTPLKLIGRLTDGPLAERAVERSKAVTNGVSASSSKRADGHNNEHRLVIKQILSVAARYFGVTQSALAGPSRRRSLVQARNAVVYFSRRLTGLSYAEIGRALGGRDHSTIMHSESQVVERLESDPATQQSIEELDRILCA